MNLYVSASLQTLVAVLQIVNGAMIETGSWFKVIIGVLLGVVQVGLHLYAGDRNPDGTSAAASYQK